MNRGFRIAGLALCLAVPGCATDTDDGSNSDPDEVNIGINNQSGRRLNVVLTIDGVDQPGISINHGAYVTEEFGGVTAGEAITVKASANDGAPALVVPTKICYPKAAIIGTTVYGQIDISSSNIGCSLSTTWQ